MHRDLSLIRQIMIAIEASTDVWGASLPTIEGHTKDQVAHHVGLLCQAGYVTASDPGLLGERDYEQIHLTWQGHEFLDALRDETVWKKVKEKVKSAGGSLSFELVKAIGMAAAKEALNLP